MPSSASSSSSSSASPSTASSWTKVSLFCVLLHRIAINVLSVHPHHLRKKHNLRCSTRQQLIHEEWPHSLFSHRLEPIIRQHHRLKSLRETNLEIGLLDRFKSVHQ